MEVVESSQGDMEFQIKGSAFEVVWLSSVPGFLICFLVVMGLEFSFGWNLGYMLELSGTFGSFLKQFPSVRIKLLKEKLIYVQAFVISAMSVAVRILFGII